MAEPLERSRWANARWLVIAPHPDDETLGAGALIAHTSAQGRLGGVAFLTNGTGSHPDGTPRVAATRRAEARCAIRRLGAGKVPIHWMNWQDAHPHPAESPTFQRTAAWLAALLRRLHIDAVAVSDWTDSHCDHVAAYQLSHSAVRQSRRSVTLFTYHVWSEHPPGFRQLLTPPVHTARLRHALQAHRSQLSPILGAGFRLAPDKLRMGSCNRLTLRRMGQ